MAHRSVGTAQGRYNRFVGPAIALLIVSAIAIPLILLTQGLDAFSKLLWRGTNGVPTGSGTIGVAPGGIVSKAIPDSRAEQLVKLADLSAERFESGGMLRRLRFVGVKFTSDSDRMTSPAERKPREMVLELNMPRELGLVVIAAEPITWSVNNRGARERARIGFEGAAPFGIRAEAGTMSGFRIGAFGSGRNAYPVDLVEETAANISQFCTAMYHWGNHFGVEIDRMEYVLLTNPTSLSINAETTIGGGRIGAHYSGSTLRNLCYGPARGARSNSSGARPIYNRVSRQWN